MPVLRLILATWLRAGAACSEHLGMATAYSLALLAQQLVPKGPVPPKPPSWLREMNDVREGE